MNEIAELWLLVGLGVVLTAGTAVFVASEFALVTLDLAIVEKGTKPGDRRGGSVVSALRHLSTELSGAQVGITVTTILLGYTTQPAVLELLGGPLRSSPLGDAVGGVLGRVPLGLTVPEMAALMGALGARRAVLLDGGLSAQLLVRDGAGTAQAWPGTRKVPLGLVALPRAGSAASAGAPVSGARGGPGRK